MDVLLDVALLSTTLTVLECEREASARRAAVNEHASQRLSPSADPRVVPDLQRRELSYSVRPNMTAATATAKARNTHRAKR